MKILVLHSRMSGYWMACMQSFVEHFDGSFTVVHKKASENAPFEFREEKGIALHDFSCFTDGELLPFCKQINPDLVYVAGWAEHKYLKACHYYIEQGVPVICGLDNHWEGSLRQRAGKYYMQYIAPDYFTHIWIPGLYQFEFACQLGFPKDKILTGMYSADVDAFSGQKKELLEKKFPHSFLFVGRFIEKKGVVEMIKAFRQFKLETENQEEAWSLTLVGNGPLKKEIKPSDYIKVLDFVQPSDLPELMSNYGAFVLPSLSEPWGVVVHEAVSAGLPIISTRACGAATAFLRDGYNGYFTTAGDVNSLRNAFHKMAANDRASLTEMGERSWELSRQITPHSWASALAEIIDTNRKEKATQSTINA